MTARLGSTLIAAVVACSPLAARAQVPPRPEPPLPLKHVRVTPSGKIWFALAGIQRARVERDVNYLGGGDGTRTDNFGVSRTQLSIDLHLSPRTQIFAEARDATARGRDLPGGTRSSDRDVWDWATLYLEQSTGFGDLKSTLRAGRQELALGRERIVSPSDFANVRRTFEGVTLNSIGARNTLTAFYAHPIVVRQTEHNIRDDNVTLWGVQSAWKRPNAPALLELYVFDKTTKKTATVPRAERTLIGGRAVTPLGASKWLAEAEGGVQFGTTGTANVRAYMLATDFTRTFVARWSPSLTFGADWSTGTRAGRAPLSGTWDVFFPLGHAYTGYADLNGRRNLVELRGVLEASPRQSIRLRASGHAFRRASDADAVYDDGGNVFRPSIAGAPRDIGKELDVTLQWRASRFFRFDVGGAVYAPGGFLRATGPAQRYTWGFGSVTVTY